MVYFVKSNTVQPRLRAEPLNLLYGSIEKKTTVTFSSNNWFRANCGMQNVMLFLHNKLNYF